jgi:hypothetical protein
MKKTHVAACCCHRARTRSDVRRHTHRPHCIESEETILPDRISSDLHRATFDGTLSEVASLVAKGSPVDFQTGDGETPLHIAAGKGNVLIAQFLLEKGANVDAQDQRGNTPLHAAICHPQLVKLLLERRASAEARNCFGDAPMHSAAFHGEITTMSLLVKWGADVGTRGHRGEAALAVAARRAKLDAVRFLIERGGAAVGSTDVSGLTALHAAAEVGAAHVCDCLFFHKAMPTESVTELLSRSARRVEEQRAADRRLAATQLPLTLSPHWADRIHRMPPLTKRLLALNENPANIWPTGLLLEQCAVQASIDSLTKFRGAVDALHRDSGCAVLRVPGALDARACAALRRAVDIDGSVTIDSVDALPNRDVPLPMPILGELIGREQAHGLMELARRYVVDGLAGEHCESVVLAGSFARRYCADGGKEQPLTSFHFDSAATTVNVALTDDTAISGGRLLGVFGGGVQVIARAEGEATVHASSLFHGVSRMEAGVRYSLILFFANARPRAVV